MNKNLNKTIGLEENKAQANAIKDKLANLMEAVKRSSTSDAKTKQKTKQQQQQKKLETETTCWKLSNVFLSLIN